MIFHCLHTEALAWAAESSTKLTVEKEVSGTITKCIPSNEIQRPWEQLFYGCGRGERRQSLPVAHEKWNDQTPPPQPPLQNPLTTHVLTVLGVSTGQTEGWKAKRIWAASHGHQSRILPVLIPTEVLVLIAYSAGGASAGADLAVEKCFPSTLNRRKNCSLSARIPQPNGFPADVKGPLVSPWHWDVATVSSNKRMGHQDVLWPLVLSSAHSDPRDSSPLSKQEGNCSQSTCPR